MSAEAQVARVHSGALPISFHSPPLTRTLSTAEQMNESAIPIDTLRSLLDCDPETGKFTWRVRGVPNWDARYAGKPACVCIGRNGYHKIYILKRKHSVHRVVWAHINGEWPPAQIDHINGIRGDNRISNLRAVSSGENARNQKMSKANKSGITGVYPAGNKWSASISVDYKTYYLGTFCTKGDATEARRSAELKHDFHPNHGRTGLSTPGGDQASR